MHVSTARCHQMSVHASAPGDEAGAENRWAGGALIDPIDRILMTSDGTVTTMLEACTGEPIVTSLTRQSGPASLDVLQREVGCWWQPSASLLELTPCERLIARRVMLQGRRSGVSLVAAESLIAADRLPDPHALDIGHVGASLGRLLNASGLATRRHIVDTAAVHDAAVNDRLDVARNVRLARRTYTIASIEQIVAAVTEWFVPGRIAAHIAATGPGTRSATSGTDPRRSDRRMFLVDL